MTTLIVEPLTASVGAEVHGVDLSRPLGTATVATIRREVRVHPEIGRTLLNGNGQDYTSRRMMRRVTITGDRPFGTDDPRARDLVRT